MTAKTPRSALVLAAGKGTRFRSERAKVLHTLCGNPMVCHVLDSLKGARVERTLLVVGHQSEQVREALGGRGLEFVQQTEQLGTGHAVLTAAPRLGGLEGSLLVLYADTPLIKAATLRRLCQARERNDVDLVLLTSRVEDPSGYGRVVRDDNGEVMAIVEEKDASPSQKRIREMNPGFYCFKVGSLLADLPRLENRNRQGEYYLTDMVKIFRETGRRMATVSAAGHETAGINDRLQLAAAERQMRRAINQEWMRKGVTMLDPESVWIDATVRLGADTLLYPGVILEGDCRIGRSCTIRAWSHLENVTLKHGAVIDHCSVLRDSTVGPGAKVGPFAHLRQDTRVGAGARVGNFVEVKKSALGEGVKAAHLTYLGDATIGPKANIGAGTITCNYDGKRKHPTVIEADAFIGSDSQLVAPVTVGKGAYVAAGSTITENVPPKALAISRGRQINKPGWADKKK